MHFLSRLPLLLLCIGLLACRSKAVPSDEAAFESAQERQAGVTEAFADNAPPKESSDAPRKESSADDNAAIDQLFKEIGKAMVNEDPAALRRHYDFEMLAGLLKKRGLVPPELLDGDLGELLSDNLAKKLATEQGSFVRHRVRKVKLFAGGKEGIAYAQLWGADGIGEKQRWWIVKKDGQWRLYDQESIDLGIRYSTLMGVAFRAASEGEAWIERLPEIALLTERVAKGETESVLPKIEALAQVDFPPEIASVLTIMKADVLLALERYEECLQAAQTVLAQRPDAYFAYYYLTGASVELEKYKEALAFGDSYIESMGGDADIYYLLARAHEELDHTDKRKSYLAQALEDDSQHIESIAMYAVYLEADEKAKLVPYLSALDSDQLDVLTEWLALWEDPEASAYLADFRAGKGPA